MKDYSHTPAAKHRFCCVCGKYVSLLDWYFPEAVRCGQCYILSDRSPSFFEQARCNREIIMAVNHTKPDTAN